MQSIARELAPATSHLEHYQIYLYTITNTNTSNINYVIFASDVGYMRQRMRSIARELASATSHSQHVTHLERYQIQIYMYTNTNMYLLTNTSNINIYRELASVTSYSPACHTFGTIPNTNVYVCKYKLNYIEALAGGGEGRWQS